LTLHFGIDLGTEHQKIARQVKPQQQQDDAPERTIGLRVTATTSCTQGAVKIFNTSGNATPSRTMTTKLKTPPMVNAIEMATCRTQPRFSRS
jgi:hypothetical protein